MRIPLRLVAALGLALPAAVGADSLERELAHRWEGAWVIVAPDTWSGCGGAYTDNDVRGDLVVSRGEHRFAPGELAVVRKVDVFRHRVELRMEIAEPLLVPFQDGPFTLYDELACRIELQLPRPPSASRADQLDAMVARHLERHPDAESARRSAGWNGRRREPYPENYDRTLAEHRRWKAAETNAAIDARRDAALEEASRLLARFERDADYREGFAAGVEKGRDRYLANDCAQLLTAGVWTFVESPPSGSGAAWRRGFEAGQALVFHLEVGHRLGGCYVPVEGPP